MAQNQTILLLAHQYDFARWRLSSSSVVICNAASVWEVGCRQAGRVGGRAADTARRASTVTSR